MKVAKLYISARANFRMELWIPFFWSSLHAVEKYLKCVLLLRRIKVRTVGHDLQTLLKIAQENGAIIGLSKNCINFLNEFNEVGPNRYFELAYVVRGRQLVNLDWLVWELRQHCELFDYIGPAAVPRERAIALEKIRQRIHRKEGSLPEKVKLVAGFLEKVLDESRSERRKSLLWRNAFFGKRSRKTLPVPGIISMHNSPLALHPETIVEVEKYIKVSGFAMTLYGHPEAKGRRRVNAHQRRN